jgi:hypothetical protein
MVAEEIGDQARYGACLREDPVDDLFVASGLIAVLNPPDPAAVGATA